MSTPHQNTKRERLSEHSFVLPFRRSCKQSRLNGMEVALFEEHRDDKGWQDTITIIKSSVRKATTFL